MNLSTRVGLVAGATVMSVAGVAAAGDLDTETRIAELEAEVAKLKGEGWMNDQRADEVRSLVQDVLADADTRSSLLQGMTAGYDHGYVIGSADGNFKLTVNGQMQVRYVFNYQDYDTPPDGDSTRYGFENSRTKLIFGGHVVDPSWQFRLEGNFSADGGAFSLEDAYIKKVLDNGWHMRVGQFRDQFSREELVWSGHQLLVDRSIANEFFTHGIVQGIEMGYTGDTFRFAGSYNDGAGSANSPALALDTEIALTARAEFLFGGTWDQFTDFTSPQGSEFGAMVGAAVSYQKGESGSPAPEIENFSLTVDGSLEGDGWNAFAAFTWVSLDDDTTGGIDNDPWTFVVQGGYYFTEDLEGFVRYEFGDLDDLGGGGEDLNVITAGVNKYFAGHGMKWTTDVGYALDGVDPAWGMGAGSLGAIGWRADDPDEDGQLVIRTQLQILF